MIFVKNRFRLICYRNCGGMYYLHDKETGDRVSLETKDKARANELLVAKNEATREPAFNLQKAAFTWRRPTPASRPALGEMHWGL